jgi:hypothetical protein
MKRILSLVITGVICASLVACSSTGSSTAQYFDTSNEEVLEKNKNFDYEEVTELETFSASSLEDKKIKICGDAKDIDIDESTLEMYLEVKNNTPYSLKVVIPSNMVNVELKEGDTITVYGRFAGLVTKTYKGKSANCWQISAYFIESGNTIKNKKESTSIKEDHSKTKDTTNTTSTSNDKSSNSTKKNKEKENKDENIKDGTHLGEEGKKQDEGYVYDPDEDTRDQEYWDSFNEDNNNNNLNNNEGNSDKGSAMDSENGIKYQYKDENGNTVKEYENGDKVTEYND